MPTIIREDTDPGVVLLRLNRPEARNALNSALREELSDQFQSLSRDQEVKAIVVTGSKEVFAAGADLKEIVDATPIEMMERRVLDHWRNISRCPKPVIAAVNGFALGGGCELALHADIIIAGRGAKFGQPEVKVGVIAGGGATQRLVRAIGKYKAMRLLLTGELISADEAFAMGFVSRVVEDDEVVSSAIETAVGIAKLPPLAIAYTKEVILAGEDISLDAALLLERRTFEMLFASSDQKEGMRSFLEKRAPHFVGR